MENFSDSLGSVSIWNDMDSQVEILRISSLDVSKHDLTGPFQALTRPVPIAAYSCHEEKLPTGIVSITSSWFQYNLQTILEYGLFSRLPLEPPVALVLDELDWGFFVEPAKVGQPCYFQSLLRGIDSPG
jgi:hypothetical protein